MRILCITDEYPWPATRGYRIRVANAVRGLAQAGSVDLFCVVSDRPDLEREPQESSLVSRVHACRVGMPGDEFYKVATTVVVRDDPLSAQAAE